MLDPVVLFFILFVVVLIVSATLIYIWCCDRKNGWECGRGKCGSAAEGVYLVGRDGRDGLPGRDGKDGVLVSDPSYAFLYVDNVVNEKIQEFGTLSLSIKEQQQEILVSKVSKIVEERFNVSRSSLEENKNELSTKVYEGSYPVPFTGNSFKTIFTVDGVDFAVGLPYALEADGTFSSIAYEINETPKIVLYDAGTLVKDFVFGLENVQSGSLYENELYVKYQGEKTKRFHVSYTVNVTDESLGTYILNDGAFDPVLNFNNPARSGGIKLFFKKRENGQPPSTESKIKGSDASMGSYPNEGPKPPNTTLISFQPAVVDVNYSPFDTEVKHPITQTFAGNFWVSLSNGDVLKMFMIAKPYFVIPDVGFESWFGFVSLDNLRISIKEID